MLFGLFKEYLVFIEAGVVFIISRAIDLFSTYVSVNSGNTEMNIFYKLLDGDLFLFISFNIVFSLVWLFIFFLIYKRFKKSNEVGYFVIGLLYFLSALFLYLGFHNLSIS